MPNEALQNFPYPAGTALAGAGDDDIRALAEAARLRVVMVFASAAARTTAFASAAISPSEGMVSWLQDVDRFEVYDGTAWRIYLVGQYRAAQLLGAPAASVVFSGIPSSLRRLRLEWTARGDAALTAVNVGIRVNGDAGNNYRSARQHVQNGVAGVVAEVAQPSAIVAAIPGASSAAGVFGIAEVSVTGWNAPHPSHLLMVGQSGYVDTAGNSLAVHLVGVYVGAAPYSSLAIVPVGGGNFVAGSEFLLTGHE